MLLNVEIAARHVFPRADLLAMHRLRARAFRDRRGWDVTVLGGMEIDGFDAIEPHYMLLREESGRLCGCWRLLPTDGPYMLKDVFPELLGGQTAPHDPRVWELSRFVMEGDSAAGFGFSARTLRSIHEVIRFGHDSGITRYVTVTTTAVERMLRQAGLAVRRVGPARQIGVETAVALWVEIGESLRTMAQRRAH
ncbi:MAG TPA: acyl-homoserine-lactone synthase [Duganella sp.]|uniref:acyl-homoserine-lactone synthase n=1 Tax=Duganella sp. TaxID=1904440 RepID=UPI002ED08CD9